MSASTVIRARIDAEIKTEAAAVLAAMGLTVSDALRLLMVRIAAEKALPFEPLVPNAETIKAMKAARRGVNAGRFAEGVDRAPQCGRLSTPAVSSATIGGKRLDRTASGSMPSCSTSWNGWRRIPLCSKNTSITRFLANGRTIGIVTSSRTWS